MKIHFVDVPIGANFTCNGNLYTKQSTRGALLIEYKRVFCFGNTEYVTLA